jgi:hypothetical protein
MIQRNDLYNQVMEKFEAVGAQNEPVKLFGIGDDSNQINDVVNDLLGYCIGQDVFLRVGSTNPGKHALVTHPEGAGHMCFGFHQKIWVIGQHAQNIPSFTHEALVQRNDRGCGPIMYWRDRHGDFTQDPDDPIESSLVCCMNMHRMSVQTNLQQIGLYGEGCQITQNHTEHETMMADIKEIPFVASTYFKWTNQKRFSDEIEGADYWEYLFSYLLTPMSKWQL